MGIRVHKVIGYGTTFPTNKPLIDFDKLRKLRLNNELLISGDVLKTWCYVPDNLAKIEKMFQQEYQRTVKSNWIELDFFWKAAKPFNLSDCVIYEGSIEEDNEVDENDIFVLISPDMLGSWYRYDDTIDWVEETAFYGSKDRIVELTNLCGIYPYNGHMVRIRPPKLGIFKDLKQHYTNDSGIHFDKLGPTMLNGGLYNQLVGRWDDDLPPLAEGEALQHFLEDWRPRLPIGVLILVAYLESCFLVDNLTDYLRPLLWVYWR